MTTSASLIASATGMGLALSPNSLTSFCAFAKVLSATRMFSPPAYQWVAKILGVPAGHIKIRQQCDGVVSLIAAVESGRGPAVVGQFIAAVAGNRVKFVPFSGGTARLEVGILYPRTGLSDRGRKFVEACRYSSGAATDTV